MLRTLLALGSSVALAACASNSTVEQGAAPGTDGAAPVVSVASSPASVAASAGAPQSAQQSAPLSVAAAPKPELAASKAQPVAMTRPRPPAGSPKQLIGKNRDEIQALLGYPWLQKREGSSELWQYRVTTCVMDLFLFGHKGGEPTVSHVELRSRRENRPAPASCFSEILDMPRPAPNQTAKG